MYAANHYVRVAGQVYVAGEILPEMPEDKAAWLLKAGAIREIAPAPGQVEPARATRAREEAPPDPQEEPAEETPEEEIDEEAEPEEIDVMAGIVTENKPSVSKGTSGKGGRKRK
jgi:hypothetical protein